MKCKIKNCDSEADPMYKPYCYDCGQEMEAMAPRIFYRENAKYMRKHIKKMRDEKKQY